MKFLSVMNVLIYHLRIPKKLLKLLFIFFFYKFFFKSKTNADLIRGLLVFRMCSINLLVQNNQRILQILRKILGRPLFKTLLKSTFYGHFVAGETQKEVTFLYI